MLLALASITTAQAEPFRLSVLMHVANDSDGEAALRSALESAQSRDPAFVVVNGLKGATERCSDQLFRRRKAVLEASETPIFLSMAGADWMNCVDRRGRPAEAAWLGLLREQLYGDISWNGSKQLSLRRQSALPAFRSYAENTRWAWQQVMFATLHLPAANNHYSTAAGRNSEFEDRLIANRDWLTRLALLASVERRKAIVLFCDGQLFPAARPPAGMRDGFAEMRSALRTFAAKTQIPVLLVQGSSVNAPPGSSSLAWLGRLAHVRLSPGVTDIEIDTEATVPFAVAGTETDSAPAP
jgi:hypothetical protein